MTTREQGDYREAMESDEVMEIEDDARRQVSNFMTTTTQTRTHRLALRAWSLHAHAFWCWAVATRHLWLRAQAFMCVLMPVVTIAVVSLAYRHRCVRSGQEDHCGERSTVAHNERTGIKEADALVDGAAAVHQVYTRACRVVGMSSIAYQLMSRGRSATYLPWNGGKPRPHESLLRMARVARAALTITIIPSLLPTHRSTALRHEASTHSDGRYSYSDGVRVRDRGVMFVWCAMWPYGAWCTGLSLGRGGCALRRRVHA